MTSRKIPFALATVVQVEGSSSARRGSKAIIDAQGKLLVGWVGGGCAESAVKSEAVKAIELGQPRMITVDMTDEQLGVGMPCGGTMSIFIEPVLPNPELLIVGHGRIAEALSALGHMMALSITVNDPGAQPEAFPHASKLVTEDFDLTETPIDRNTYVVIATQHKRDHLWLEKALEANAAYVALIASHHRTTLVLDYLRSKGLANEKIARVHAPAGLDLGAATPEEIALSVISQIVAIRRGAISSDSPEFIVSRSSLAAADAIIRQCEAGDPR